MSVKITIPAVGNAYTNACCQFYNMAQDSVWDANAGAWGAIADVTFANAKVTVTVNNTHGFLSITLPTFATTGTPTPGVMLLWCRIYGASDAVVTDTPVLNLLLRYDYSHAVLLGAQREVVVI